MSPIVNRGDGEAAQDTDEIAVFDILLSYKFYTTTIAEFNGDGKWGWRDL